VEADVFPSIIVVEKPTEAPKPEEARVCTIPREQLRIDDLGDQITKQGFGVPLTALGSAVWQLEKADIIDLLNKLTERGVPLREHAGAKPFFGVKTGCNEAFLIDTNTRN
jgi:hypothetical protein